VGLVLGEHPIPLPLFSLFWLSPLLPVHSPIIIHTRTLFYKFQIHLIAHSIPPTPPCPLSSSFSLFYCIYGRFFCSMPHHYTPHIMHLPSLGYPIPHPTSSTPHILRFFMDDFFCIFIFTYICYIIVCV
jgi:hypothetical protein